MRYICILFFLLALSACSSLPKSPFSSKALKKSSVEKVDFQFAMAEKEVQVQAYGIHTLTDTYERDQIVNSKEEGVDFKVQSFSEKAISGESVYPVSVSTIEKEGFINLNTYNFPELGERVFYVFGKKGEILEVENQPEDSAYYLPNFVMPTDTVQVGDTWFYEKSWISEANNLPLSLKLVSILKSTLECNHKLCADVELSGTVEILEEEVEGLFESELVGRVLVEVSTGKILWQKIKTREVLRQGEGRVESFSCTSSYLDMPKIDSIPLSESQKKCPVERYENLFVEPLI